MYASGLAAPLRQYLDRRAQDVAARLLAGSCETHGDYLAAAAEHRTLADVRAIVDQLMGELGDDNGG